MHDRNFKRVSFLTKATVLSGEHFFEAMAENISIDGLFIRTDHIISIGDTVTVILYLPSASRSSTITVSCVVIRKDDNGLALQFKALDDETFTILKTVLTSKFP